MDVRIGTTVGGRVVGFDTTRVRALMLVGDVGRGKTTTARYLTRWWLANTRRHAHLYAQAPSEWADLGCEPVEHPDQSKDLLGRDCRAGACLVVVDDMDLLDHDHLAHLARLPPLSLGGARTILTSHGATNLAGHAPPAGDVTCLGLIRPEHADPAETAVLDGQGRLDWPTDTVAVIPDQRGPLDFPCHRWQTPGAWTPAAR